MKKLALLLFTFFFLFGCEPKETVSVPIIPVFKAAHNEIGEPFIIDNKETFNKIKYVFIKQNIEVFPSVYVADEKYVVVDHEWVLELLGWWDDLKWSFGIEYIAEGFDCDNFADFLSSVVDFSNMKGEKIKAEIILGKLSVYQQHEFGRVGAGSYHALNFFISDRGMFIVEPQGGASTVAKFEDYPNAEYIRAIKLN